MRKRLLFITLSIVMLLSMATPTLAVGDEQTVAVQYVTEHGIFVGDQNGNLNLESGLTRAELATLLTRINNAEQAVKGNEAQYAALCSFTDVPTWAKPYVGYCAEKDLMMGYSKSLFGAYDPVNLRAACTVMLRYLGHSETDWSYETSYKKAVSVAIAPEGLAEGEISRGTFAVLIYRAVNDGTPSTGNVNEVKGQTVADGSGSVSDTKIVSKLIEGRDFSREDFSQQANPAIFQGAYTRGMYNALRQSILDRDVIWPGNNGTTAAKSFNPYYSYASAVADSYETSQAYEAVLTHISALYGFRVSAEPYATDLWKYPGYFIVTVMKTDYSLDSGTVSIISQAKNQANYNALQTINDHVRSRISYDAKGSAGVEQVLNSTSRVKGACGTYAKSFKYLCDVLEIPAFVVNGDNHAWVMVHVDGQWWHCDPTNDQVMASSIGFEPYHPHNIEFMKEILKPGSTK